jgi:hypothetical protein
MHAETTSFYDGLQHLNMNGDSWREEAACFLWKMQIFQRQQDECVELNQHVTAETRQCQLRRLGSKHRHSQAELQLP